MKTVVITKSKWHTQGGNTRTASSLRSSVSKRMCCLGFAAQQAGCVGLTGLGFPSDLPKAEAKKFKVAYPRLDAIILANINDDERTTREKKAKRITAAGKTMGVNFVFVP